MPGWVGSDRLSRLPSDWRLIRDEVFRRDGYRCCFTVGDLRCVERATDCDHIVPGDDHSLENLQSLCSYHHRLKSSSEGGRAAQARSRGLFPVRRPLERHPGDPAR